MTHPYVTAVAAHLRDLPRALRTAALDDLQAVLDEGIDPGRLGEPAAYAAELLADLTREPESSDPVADVFGIPFEARGLTDAGVRGRLWAPQDPRLIVPRLLGGGWTLNLGAVAVKLGLLRPDDWDDESHADIPPALVRCCRTIPTGIAAGTVVACVIAARGAAATGGRVPTHWDVAGRVDRWGDQRWLAVPAAVAVMLAVWGAMPTQGDDTFVRPAVAGYGAALAAGIAGLQATTLKSPDRPSPAALPLLLAPAAVVVGMIAVPVAVAVRRSWRKRG